MLKENLVFQSYRTSSVPESIKICQQSVRDWAATSRYSYQHIGDEFFEIVPDWYIKRCDGEKLPITDLARLLWAKQFLLDGWRRVIWIDSDVIIFDGDKINFELPYSYALNREIWLWREERKRYVYRRAINNCAMMFEAVDGFLTFYIDACLRLAKEKLGPIYRTDMGPKLLSAIIPSAKCPLVEGIGLFSPLVLWDLADQNIESFLIHSTLWGGDIGGANLCGSLSDKDVFRDQAIQDETFTIAISFLNRIAKESNTLNKWQITAREVACKEEADHLNQVLMSQGYACE